jgi:hypothetical protein
VQLANKRGFTKKKSSLVVAWIRFRQLRSIEPTNISKLTLVYHYVERQRQDDNYEIWAREWERKQLMLPSIYCLDICLQDMRVVGRELVSSQTSCSAAGLRVTTMYLFLYKQNTQVHVSCTLVTYICLNRYSHVWDCPKYYTNYRPIHSSGFPNDECKLAVVSTNSLIFGGHSLGKRKVASMRN